MNEVIRSRLLVLAGLTVIGVGLAGAGTAMGLTEPLSTTDLAAEFIVSEENVAFSAGGKSETIVENMSYVSEVEIEETDAGQFTIHTTEDQPLTDSERERARTIAVNNATVKQTLDAMSAYELSVEPVQRINVTGLEQASLDAVNKSDQTDDVVQYELADNGTVTEDQGGGTVTVNREPRYAEDRAVVRIRQPGEDCHHDLKYTINVDLASGTVTGITDWDEIRQSSSPVTMTGTRNTTETAR